MSERKKIYYGQIINIPVIHVGHNKAIGCVMVSVLAWSVVIMWSGQTNGYRICICCFSAKHAALKSKNKDWFAQNQDNVLECSDIHRQTVVSVM